MSDFTDCMEAKARPIATKMEKECSWWKRERNGQCNIKPWYSPYANFEPEACDVVVIGVNPGGNPRRPDNTTGPAYGVNLKKPRGEYNAYLDETWEGKTAPGEGKLQRGVVRLFKTLYGADDWERQLRNAASFNVCPLRTRLAPHIPWVVWNESVPWCREILTYLQPQRIICNSNYRKRTPWTVVGGSTSSMGFERNVTRPQDEICAKVQVGTAGLAGLNRCEVIGVPHLSYHYDNDAVFEALGAYANTR